jgi:hypothetical protein
VELSAGLVDVDRRLVQLAQREGHALPLVVVEPPVRTRVLVEAADR